MYQLNNGYRAQKGWMKVGANKENEPKVRTKLTCVSSDRMLRMTSLRRTVLICKIAQLNVEHSFFLSGRVNKDYTMNSCYLLSRLCGTCCNS